MDIWDSITKGFDFVSEALEPVTSFIDKNEKLINVAITGATGYYGYQQQQQAIAAQESASARALALQQAQYDTEKRSMQLQATNENATIDLISRMSSSGGSINDFLYDKSTTAQTTKVGLGLGDFEKKLELV